MQHFCDTKHHSQIKRKCWSVFVRIVVWTYVGVMLTIGRIMWVIGAIIAAAGMQVYIVWGTVSFSTPVILLVKVQ